MLSGKWRPFCLSLNALSFYSHASEEQAVLVCLVMRGQIVVVEDTDLKDSVVGGDGQVRDGETGSQLETQEERCTEMPGLGLWTKWLLFCSQRPHW